MEQRPSVDEIRTLLRECPSAELADLIAILTEDPRLGVRALVRSAARRLERDTREQARLDALMDMQRALHARGRAVVAGVDEVGRGALAGPVTTCAVVLRADTVIIGLDDSKRLTREKRETIAAAVRELAVAYCVAEATPAEIDSLGIAGATRLAWRRAIDGLGIEVDHVLIDGNDAVVGREATPVIGGDSKCACIAAASVIAKVERDRYMAEVLAPAHPAYGFELNRGYGTPEHMQVLADIGPSAAHRHSFSPCMDQETLF
ncbi:MAG: ribonuclease HII [Coriobacteriia bacterium]|nr:ribonuclease HII [Coriobacteriia bacterium]